MKPKVYIVMKLKILSLLFLFGFSQSLFALKQHDGALESNPYAETFAKIHYWNYQLNSAQDTNTIKDIIKTELRLGENDELKVASALKSLTATHITFNQYYKGTMVFGGVAKVAVSNNNVLFRCLETVFNTNGNIGSLPEDFNTMALLANFEEIEFVQSSAAYLWDGNRVVPGWYARFRHANNGFHDAAWKKDGTLLFLEDQKSYAEDTIAKMLVFNPDPITPISKPYGGLYVDDNDFNTAILDPLRDTVEIEVENDNGVYRLKNDFVEIVEADFPVFAITTSTSPEFYFSRNHFSFEQVNAYYHVLNYQNYLQTLGYSLVQYPIRVDAQGFSGLDNSAFNPGSTPYPLLSFGEGGVDDAEDADVVVHEYGHAISHSAAPSSNMGNERRCLDEAFGDYVAVSYKKDIYSYGSDFVFNWDGHNEYWPGRTVNNPQNYCYDNISSFNNIYQYTTVWNKAMFEIWQALGKTYTDKLQIEALHGYVGNMSFRDAALLILDADTALTGGGSNSLVIWEAFDDVCILKWSDLTERGGSAKPYILKNTFTASNKPVEIEISSARNAKVDILDMNGRIIANQQLDQGSNELRLGKLSSGMYLLSIEVDQKLYTEKIIFN